MFYLIPNCLIYLPTQNNKVYKLLILFIKINFQFYINIFTSDLLIDIFRIKITHYRINNIFIRIITFNSNQALKDVVLKIIILYF
jgi:hypothetical protein